MEKESEIKNRLYYLVEELGLNPSRFSSKIGKDRTYLSNISKEIQTDVLRNIYIAFPQVNLVWLITGKGEIFLPEPNLSQAATDLKTLLTTFNEERRLAKQLQKEKDELMDEKMELKECIHQLEMENLKLKQQLGSDLSPSSKAV